MPTPIAKLQKFLNLETERGYDNRAVVGGIDKIVPAWRQEAIDARLSETLVNDICSLLLDYPLAEISARSEIVYQILNQIKEIPENVSSIPYDQAEKPAIDHSSSSRPVQKFSKAAKPPEFESMPTDSGPARKIEPVGLKADLTVLHGIGAKSATQLKELGLHTLEDLLYYFPRRYDDFSQMKKIINLQYGDELSVAATVSSIHQRTIKGGKATMTEAVFTDGTGSLRVNWFNQPWIERNLRPGTQAVLSGKVDIYLGRLCMTNPDWEPIEQEHLHTNRIVPVYPLKANVTQKILRRIIYQTTQYWAPRLVDYMPDFVIKEGGLVSLQEALRQIHFPDDNSRLKAAQDRLAFDEIFLIQLGVLRQKKVWQSNSAQKFLVEDQWVEAQKSRLPFELTPAQNRVLEDIRSDLASGHPMNRLLQGDVGSGKTAVAALAVLMVTHSNAQAAMMAPTGILAEQHYRNLIQLLTSESISPNPPLLPDEIRLLIGDTPESEKQVIRDGLKTGAIRLVIGTHALIEDPIEFQKLQLAIIDEQHRFGVQQRALLRAKGDNPHLLVMTATPIPRSLALTIYGDLDLSILDEMPPGRKPVKTYAITPLERERAYSFIRSQTETGRQAFIIYPLVENSDNGDVLAAVQEQERLQNEVFQDLKIGLIHGRLKADEKELVMTAFRDGSYHILVSTSVIEVGVDIPNATVMLIEGANRFGLAQLHQFRGRVGRGSSQSYCILIPDKDDAVENARLTVMTDTNDGFILAEKDLEQRGPGQFLGTRQAGFTELKVATLSDVRTIEKARNLAQRFFEQDYNLNSGSFAGLQAKLDDFWEQEKIDFS